MRVYIPFQDGSVVSYDGKIFTLHKQPISIDANLSALSEGMALQLWRERRGDLVKTLEAAWWKELRQRKERSEKNVYSKHAQTKAE
ncbi:MAG: hypothetical protein LBJ22_04050 [Synergistaceae bacterium]|jgi:hypothetical protein|nr:hypothetical protein [Synergistaceae bacterium]